MRIIKKYSNRRLYDTTASAYVNLDELAALVATGEQVQVLDAQSGEDLSKAVLLQILIEQEGGGALFPVGLLHRMIRFCGQAPWQRALSGQLATGMELLDAQLTQLEQQWGWMRRDAAPPPRPAAATPPSPEPPAEPPPAASAQQRADPAAEATADPAADPELDALRQRLAALEARLGGSKGAR